MQSSSTPRLGTLHSRMVLNSRSPRSTTTRCYCAFWRATTKMSKGSHKLRFGDHVWPSVSDDGAFQVVGAICKHNIASCSPSGTTSPWPSPCGGSHGQHSDVLTAMVSNEYVPHCPQTGKCTSFKRKYSFHSRIPGPMLALNTCLEQSAPQEGPQRIKLRYTIPNIVVRETIAILPAYRCPKPDWDKQYCMDNCASPPYARPVAQLAASRQLDSCRHNS